MLHHLGPSKPRAGRGRASQGGSTRRGSWLPRRSSTGARSDPANPNQPSSGAFDTPRSKTLRESLREAPQVSAALDAWWDATDVDKSGDIDRDEYVELGKAFYRVMINDGDEEEAEASAEHDWEEDRKGYDVMDGSRFKRAIFE